MTQPPSDPAAEAEIAPREALRAVLDRRVDGQVWLASLDLCDDRRQQPEWLWSEEDRTSFGRWSKTVRQAPYIRGDIVIDNLLALLADIAALRTRAEEARMAWAEWQASSEAYRADLLALARMYGEACADLMDAGHGFSMFARAYGDASEGEIAAEARADELQGLLVTHGICADKLKADLAESRAEVARQSARVDAALTEACQMSAILLMAGEMTAQERRTARAVAEGLATKVRLALNPEGAPDHDAA